MSLYMAAVGQHVGKTSVCLGLIHALEKAGHSVSYYKPFGPPTDRALFDTSNSYHVGTYRGFTQTQNKRDAAMHARLIKDAFHRIRQASDYTLVEGSGHVAVGSIVGLSNATIASQLGTPIVLVANAGIGSSIDQLVLNATFCQSNGVPVAGCILNRIDPERMDKIVNHTVPWLEDAGIPVLAKVTECMNADTPSLCDLEALGATVLSGRQSTTFDTFDIASLDLDAVNRMLSPDLLGTNRRCLLIHASRHADVIAIATILENLDTPHRHSILLTGHPETTMNSSVLKQMLRNKDVDVFRMECSTLDVVDRIRAFKHKISPDDVSRRERVAEHYSQCIDIGVLRRHGIFC